MVKINPTHEHHHKPSRHHQVSNVPTRKVSAATLGSALGGVIIWYLNKNYPALAQQESVTALIDALPVILSGGLGYFVAPSHRETVVETHQRMHSAIIKP